MKYITYIYIYIYIYVHHHSHENKVHMSMSSKQYHKYSPLVQLTTTDTV